MFTKTLVQKCHTFGRTPIPPIARNLVPRKNLVCKICVSWTVLMIQLMQKSPNKAYIGQNQRKWKPH